MPKVGERILDLGCGDGALSEVLADAGARVIGVDGSAAQIEAARKRAAGRRNLEFRVMDGQALDFDGVFDAVFSNAALHWMKRPDAVIAGVYRALRPGGRFVGEMGGAGNVASIAGALEAALDRRGLDGRAANPWYFPTPAEYRRRLEAGGFVVQHIELFPRPTPLPSGFRAWLETFGESFLIRLPEAERDAAMAEVEEAVAPALRQRDGSWVADYVRLRFSARCPR